MNYVLGFAFSEYPPTPGVWYVALVRKNRPHWMAGLLNGVGGKMGVEIGSQEVTFNETEHEAMVREFKEETGADTRTESWIHFADMVIPGGNVAVFTGQMEWEKFRDLSAPDKCDEPVSLIRMDRIHEYTPLYNLAWLIPMAKFFLSNSTRPALKIEELDFPACGLCHE